MPPYNLEYKIEFNDIEYILYLILTENELKISLEQSDESNYWVGVFESKYLEEITNKAGSFKNFTVFCKMLMSALPKSSDSVLIELISNKDLELMRQKRLNSNTNSLNDSMQSVSGDLAKMNKKYLIVSYNSDFEKVHYPLPLNWSQNSNSETLLRTIERLRKNNCKTNDKSQFNIINVQEIEELKSENLKLKSLVKLLESQRRPGAVENEEILKNTVDLKNEYDNYKLNSESKIKLLTSTIEELKKFNIINNKKDNEKDFISKIEELEIKLKKAGELIINEKKQCQIYINEKNKEQDKLQKEITFSKEKERQYKVKINQLEKDLQQAEKRNTYSNSLSRTRINSTPKSNLSNKSSNKSIYSKDSSNKSIVKRNLLIHKNSSMIKGELISKNNIDFKKVFGSNFSKQSSSSNKAKSIYSNNSVSKGSSLKSKMSFHKSTSSNTNIKNNFYTSKNSNTNILKKFANFSNLNSKQLNNSNNCKNQIKSANSINKNNINSMKQGNDEISTRLGKIRQLLTSTKI